MSNNIVQFNEEIIKGQIKELVRGSVEENPQRTAGSRSRKTHPGGQIRAQ